MAWTSPKTFSANAVLTASELNTHLRDNLKALTEWTSYTPTWTATGGTPTLGTGTLEGRYIKAGNLLHLRLALVWGSTTSAAGTTLWTFSLPSGVTFSGLENQGPATAYDSSTQTVALGYTYGASGASTFETIFTGANQRLGLTIPWTWASGDRFQVNATYEIA